MGHVSGHREHVYAALAERLNKNPVGTPINETLMEILQRLYTVGEAQLGSKMPFRPVTAMHMTRNCEQTEEELATILEHMSAKGLVADFRRGRKTYYMLTPMVVGFFEFTFMRRGRADLTELAELFNTYFRIPAVRKEMFHGGTKVFRALAYESVLPIAVETEVLAYDRASQIIRDSDGGALGTCSCRHKAEHLGQVCSAPVDDICTSLGLATDWVIRQGFGRKATVDDLLQNLQRAEDAGLVILCDNVMGSPSFLCFCCGCCCEVLTAINDSGLASVQPGNYRPHILDDACTGCSACAKACHIHAITMGTQDGKRRPDIQETLCIGCGVCAAACPAEACLMKACQTKYVPPKNKQALMSTISREKGRTGA